VGVVYIGDRAVGKTHLAFELANPQGKYVKVSNLDYDNLKVLLLKPDGTAKPTEVIDTRYLDIQVELPASVTQIYVDWIDSPGEIFRATWQKSQPDEWKQFLGVAARSEGMLLILPPYREILLPHVDGERFITRQQWCNRFERWAKFFCYECPQARHILICLNMADLFCNLEQEAQKLAYKPYGSQATWLQRHNHVFMRYFSPIQPYVEMINKSVSGLSVHCFITSIYNRDLLELPWIYLASHLA